MAIRNKKKALFIAAIILWASIGFAQNGSAPLTQDEFNLVVQYVQRGSLPILSDSSTIVAVFSMRSKLDSIVTKKLSLAKLTFTQEEKSIVSYLYRNELKVAVDLIRLNEKLNGRKEPLVKK